MNILFLCIVLVICLYKIVKITGKKEILEEKPTKDWVVIGGVFLLVFGILISRIMGFGSYPSFIHVDEAGIAYDAYCIATQTTDRYLKSFPVYMINFGGGQSALYTYIAALFIKIFGFSTITVRIPMLLFYIASIGVMYAIVAKWENKKTAWITAFLITICPWHIIQSSYALDCNLLAPMFVGIIGLLTTSKRWWQYLFTGILVGITLYTYSLSWLIIPVCLVIWLVYMLYTRKIKIKNIVLMGIPTFLLALPLFCFIAVNKGILPEVKWGIFTIPKLYEFRIGEIGFQNLANIKENLYAIFYKGTLDATTCFYYAEWIFAFIGICVTAADFMKNRKKRNFVFSHFMLLTVIAMLGCFLLVNDMNTTKANAFYMPMLYFAALGIKEIAGNKKVVLVVILLLHIIAFLVFECYYYTKFNKEGRNAYNDVYLYTISKKMEQQFPDREIYIVTGAVAQPYIYTMIANQISAEEFDATKEVKYTKLANDNYHLEVTKVGRYHFVEGGEQAANLPIEENAVYVVQAFIYKFMQEQLVEKMEMQEIYHNEYIVFYK